MRINNIKTTPVYTQKQQKTLSLPKLNTDTVSFGNKVDFLNLPKEVIFRRLNKALQNPDNFLGMGSEAVIYKIPGTDYCFRIPYLDNEGYVLTKWDSFFSKDVNKAERINHIVANLGQGASVMNKIDGEPISLILPAHKCLLDFPLGSFQKLIRQIQQAKENNLVFDSCCANIIYNNETKNIVAIDFNESYKKSELNYNILNKIHSVISFSFDEKESLRLANKLLLATLNEFGHTTDIDKIKCFEFINYIQTTHPHANPKTYSDLKEKFENIELLNTALKNKQDVKTELSKLISETKQILQRNIQKETK